MCVCACACGPDQGLIQEVRWCELATWHSAAAVFLSLFFFQRDSGVQQAVTQSKAPGIVLCCSLLQQRYIYKWVIFTRSPPCCGGRLCEGAGAPDAGPTECTSASWARAESLVKVPGRPARQ